MINSGITSQGRIHGLQKGGSKVKYEAPKRGVNCLGGGIAAFDVFLDKTLEMVQFWDTHTLVLSEIGPNEINPKVRHATSYEFSVYNTDFWEEYGIRPCPVVLRIC